jgi:hypothetical protein
MAKPSRSWAIIQALKIQLQTITVANGYNTDAGLNVWDTEGQRTDDNALGIMIYSEAITGPGVDVERPKKAVREIGLLLECSITTDLDTAQPQIHNIIEDIEVCLDAYAAGYLTSSRPSSSMHLTDVAILDRPEGMAVVAMNARVAARYVR